MVYSDDMVVRKVATGGLMRYRGFQRSIGKPFEGYPVGVEQFEKSRFRVWFGDFCVGVGNLPWLAPLRPPGSGENNKAWKEEQQEV